MVIAMCRGNDNCIFGKKQVLVSIMVKVPVIQSRDFLKNIKKLHRSKTFDNL